MFIVIEMLGGPEYAIIVTDTEGRKGSKRSYYG